MAGLAGLISWCRSKMAPTIFTINLIGNKTEKSFSKKAKNTCSAMKWPFFRTAWQPYRLRDIHGFCVNLSDFHGLNSIFFKIENYSMLCFIEIKISQKLWVVWMGLNFYDCHEFHPKIRCVKQYDGKCIFRRTAPS